MDPPRPARRGRPPIEDGCDTTSSNRKARLRKAQREYRNRQIMALHHEKAQVEKLRMALGRAAEAFNHFHTQMLQPHQQQLPQHALIHLSDMAAEISRIVGDVKMDTDAPDLSKSPLLSSNTELSESPKAESGDGLSNKSGLTRSAQDPIQSLPTMTESPAVSLIVQTRDSSQLSITGRMFRAFWEYIMFLLTKRFDHEHPQPALIIPLQALGRDLLMADLRSLPALNGHVTEPLYARHAAQRTPLLYRVIEGDGRIVPRQPTPFIQQLKFGKTRTILHTGVPDLQGEWLEAPDVEEYLEGRGICLRNGTSFHRPNRAAADQIHEDADWSVFGVGLSFSSPITSGSDVSPVSGPSQTNATRLDESPSMLEPQTLSSQVFTPMKIGVDIDKLIQTLAANATCLGPVPGIRREAVDYAIQQSVTKFDESSD